MPPSKSNLALAEFNRNLAQSQKVLEDILNDFQKNGINFNEINLEVKRLISSVKELTDSLDEQIEKYQDLQIKVVLLEHKVDELKKFAEEIKTKNISLTVQEKASRTQIVVAIISGSVGLITASVALIVNLLK
jgi:chromosome segregation ATPase